MNKKDGPVLAIVVPCYNEEEVLPVTAPIFLEKLQQIQDAVTILIIRHKDPPTKR